MFAHLHVHTEYSLLDGLSRIEPLVQQTKALGMDSLAITDHGVLYGALDFYRAAKAAGIKPIIGCEMYVAPGSRHDKNARNQTPYHITILAKNLTGYGNLVKLASAAHLEGFYYKPRIDRELLQQHHEGLIVLSGCPSGELPRLLSEGRINDAMETANWYRDLFGDYYLELMEHGGVDQLPSINKGLMQLHRDLDLPVVATNDSHYTHQRDARLQDILVCIQTNTNIHDEGRLKMTEDSYYLKSPEEMSALYPELPEAISNTQTIANMCDLELTFSQLHLPKYEVPNGATADSYLNKICQEGIKRRINHVGEKEKNRLSYELEVIKQTRYAEYFLVVWDIARFARRNDIFFAVRGSAAGSLALYSLGITDINPLEYNVVFERFLNVERKDMPDIDMDFQDDRREEILNYIVDKYGQDHVAQILTFGTLGAKAAIRDVGRALAMPYPEVDRIARMVPSKLNITLTQAMNDNPELQEVYDADQNVAQLVDTARGLEGVTRHASTHAAGVVISKDALVAHIPLQRTGKDDNQLMSTTQYAMEPIAALGLLKMDFLGLINLTILSKTRDLITKIRDQTIVLKDIPLNDKATFEMLSDGYTAGVFQLESTGMTRHIKELKPTTLVDVAAMIALYRPGPMEHIDTFVAAKHGRTKVKYIHDSLQEILKETYGVIVYQDQVFHIAQGFAGYSLGEADVLRKAMGKKIPAIMNQERTRFIQGAINQGHGKGLAEEVFALIEPFAGYGFPKAHAVSYGLISYWTAYFKANYPEEYMACLLNAYSGNSDKLAGSVTECKRLKIPVLPPNVNFSAEEFTVEHQEDDVTAVRFGLATIKNVGTTAVHPIVKARKKQGPFDSIEQMCRVANMEALNRKALESLIKAGAFDSFGSRGGLLESMGRILSLSQSEANLRNSKQTSMFDMFGESVPAPLAKIDVPEIAISSSERSAWEYEFLSVDLTNNNLLYKLADNVDSDTIISQSQITPDMVGSKIVMVGQVSSASQRFTRENKPFTIASLKLMEGNVDVLIWENHLAETEGLWTAGTLVTVRGTVRVRNDQINISCFTASKYVVQEFERHAQERIASEPVNSPIQNTPSLDSDQAPFFRTSIIDNKYPPNDLTQKKSSMEDQAKTKRLILQIQETDQPQNDQRLLEELSRLLLENPGEDEVGLEVYLDGRIVSLEWPLLRVKICSSLEESLKQLLGSTGRFSIEQHS